MSDALSPPAVNPVNIALLNRAPYLTVSEYKAAPQALDLSSLVQGGTTAQQTASLAMIIDRASSWVDQHCFPLGTGGTLAASTDIDTGRYRIRRDGTVALICRFKPVLELDSFSIGPLPSLMGPLAAGSYGDVWFRGKTIYVPTYGYTTTLTPQPFSIRAGSHVFVTWSYVNGYPHTTLATPATAGQTSLTVDAVLGVYPGTMLTIYDVAAGNETVVVQSATTTAGQTVLQLAAPLQLSHAVPAAPDAVSVSALPPAVRQAVILLIGLLIKTKGDDGIVLESFSEPGQQASSPKAVGSVDDMDIVRQLLEPFRIVTGQR